LKTNIEEKEQNHIFVLHLMCVKGVLIMTIVNVCICFFF